MKQEIELWLDSVPERQRKYILSRWNEWRPATELATGNEGSVIRATYLCFLLRVRRLLESQLPWVTIRKHRMDNPLATDEEFDSQLQRRVAWRKTNIAGSQVLKHNRKVRNHGIRG